MLVSFSHTINDSHIAEVYYCQCKHDLSRHHHNTRHQLRPRMNSVPTAQHQRRIAQVQQVIAGEQHAVDEICQLYIIMQQLQDKNTAIAVKNKSHPDCNDISDEEVKDISDGVHTSGVLMFGIGTFAETKLILNSKLSNNSESLFHFIFLQQTGAPARQNSSWQQAALQR